MRPHSEADAESPLVLFADDEVALHGLISGLLASHTYRTDCQPNGLEALQSFRRRRHDAVITDLMMPQMNGYEFLRELRAIDPSCMERTIILTGTTRDTWQWFDRRSVAAFLTKPVDLEQLLEELSGCIARVRRRPSA